jgi:hypothetical protein
VGNGNADIALLAVDIVFAETFALSANATIDTMIDLLAAVVVPELAYIAVVPRRVLSTVDAILSGCLRGPTSHAEHVLCHPPVQVVVLNSIVTMPTGVPVTALMALDLHVALVVLAAKRRAIFCGIKVLIFALVVRIIVGRAQPVGGLRIPGMQVERVLGIDIGRCRDRRRGVDIGEYRLARGGREGAVVRYKAAGRLRAKDIVALCHQAMHYARLLAIGNAQVSYLVYASTQEAHAIVCR